MSLAETRGMIFNIQHYAIHDGPGIRTTVFLMGCPLRCDWCQNPESQSLRPVILFASEKCTGCGQCVEACLRGANRIVEGKVEIDRSVCQGIGDCIAVCPAEARSLMGRSVTADEVFEDVKTDELFYRDSGGGVTLSGGDPVAQPEFAVSLLSLCRQAGFHTAVDTCGLGSWGILEKILASADLVLFDLKHMDPERHRQLTGRSNRLILDNAKNISNRLKRPMLIRLPLVPGFNDSTDNLVAAAKFISEKLSTVLKVHLLPYHRLGAAKYENMGLRSACAGVEPPGEERMEEIRKLFDSFGLTTVVGG